MKRRAGGDSKPSKSARKRALRRPRGRRPAAVGDAEMRRRIESLERDLRQRTDDLNVALEQQTATSEILRVISRSRGQLQPVFDAMLSNALTICEAKYGNLLLYDEHGFHLAASNNTPRPYAELFKTGSLHPGPNTALARIAREKQIVHIADLATGAAYAERDPLRMVTLRSLKARTFLAVPMLTDDQFMGAIVIYRQEVRPFTVNDPYRTSDAHHKALAFC